MHFFRGDSAIVILYRMFMRLAVPDVIIAAQLLYLSWLAIKIKLSRKTLRPFFHDAQPNMLLTFFMNTTDIKSRSIIFNYHKKVPLIFHQHMDNRSLSVFTYIG